MPVRPLPRARLCLQGAVSLRGRGSALLPHSPAGFLRHLRQRHGAHGGHGGQCLDCGLVASPGPEHGQVGDHRLFGKDRLFRRLCRRYARGFCDTCRHRPDDLVSGRRRRGGVHVRRRFRLRPRLGLQAPRDGAAPVRLDRAHGESRARAFQERPDQALGRWHGGLVSRGGQHRGGKTPRAADQPRAHGLVACLRLHVLRVRGFRLRLHLYPLPRGGVRGRLHHRHFHPADHRRGRGAAGLDTGRLRGDGRAGGGHRHRLSRPHLLGAVSDRRRVHQHHGWAAQFEERRGRAGDGGGQRGERDAARAGQGVLARRARAVCGCGRRCGW